MTHASRNTSTGLFFESGVKCLNEGINLSKKKLGKYYTEKTGKYYSLSSIRANKAKGIPSDKEEKAKMFEGKYLFARALEPDEAYLDEKTNTLIIYEKKFQETEGSADEKLQTSGFKILQYRKLAKELGIEKVKFIYILCDYFKSPYYKDVLDYINSIPDCGYYFVEDMNGIK
jgi:hypothetical protein